MWNGEDDPEEEAEHEEAVVSRKKQKVCVCDVCFLTYIYPPKPLDECIIQRRDHAGENYTRAWMPSPLWG